MVRRARLDAELVRRGLARSREQAVALIAAGRVQVAGRVAVKAGTGVDPGAALRVVADRADPGYVSRGGYKLAAALDSFGVADPPLVVAGRRCLDAGASTGGFTDALLRAGAATVYAVDVGYGQLAWSLRTDPRVVVHDRVNARSLSAELLGGPVDLTVADLSFISLRLVLAALWRSTATDGDLVLLVKPQFEAGRTAVGRRGVVGDPRVRAAAVSAVADRGWQLGLGCRGLLASPLPGPAGNVEFLLWLASGAPPLAPAVASEVAGADRAAAP